MSVASNLRTLYALAVAPVSGKTHAERLESFYQRQAGDYDAFRERLLQGRREMFAALDVPEDAVWADLGGGTGASIDFMLPHLGKLSRGYIVDLSPSLLAQARARIESARLDNIRTVEEDVTTFTPENGQLDVVTFSYSLTMIPDWFAAIEHAWQLLKPGGIIGAVDFYVSRKYPQPNLHNHDWFTRSLWPLWFACDDVRLSSEHVPYLHWRFQRDSFVESKAKVPMLPLVCVPYYYFIGRKPED